MMSRTSCAIRRARPGDLRAVLDVHAEHGNRVAGAASEPEQHTWLRMMETPDLSVYVADFEGHVVGTATAMVMPNITYHCAPTVFIEAVVVKPSMRRRGIATALVRQVLDDAAGGGCNKVQLLSHKRHATDGAHDLYSKLGFKAEAEGFRLYLQSPPAHATRDRSADRIAKG